MILSLFQCAIYIATHQADSLCCFSLDMSTLQGLQVETKSNSDAYTTSITKICNNVLLIRVTLLHYCLIYLPIVHLQTDKH